jgi:hypothetical protein
MIFSELKAPKVLQNFFMVDNQCLKMFLARGGTSVTIVTNVPPRAKENILDHIQNYSEIYRMMNFFGKFGYFY